MASYPSSIVVLADNKADATVSAGDHAAHHDSMADEIVAIETELGTNPKGGFTDVKTRLASTLINAPTANQVVQATGDFTPIIVKASNLQNTQPLFAVQNVSGTTLAYWDRLGTLSAVSLLIAGVALASTHLSDSAALARLASPTFTGSPAAPTAAPGDNTTKLATTAFTTAAIAAASPGPGSITNTMLATNAVTNVKITNGTIDGTAKIQAGTTAGGPNFGTAFPTTGLFVGYRFTLFHNNQAYEFVYRSDIDATHPWVQSGSQGFLVDLGGGSTTSLSDVLTASGTGMPFPGLYFFDINQKLMSGGQSNAPTANNSVYIAGGSVFTSSSNLGAAGGREEQMRMMYTATVATSVSIQNYIRSGSVSADAISTQGSFIICIPRRISN